MKLKQWASLGMMWVLGQAVGYAADVNVTVLWQGGTGTFTTNVNVYVEHVGQSKTLSVTPQSGYRFKGNVNTAPSGLTVTGSQGNYTLTIVSGNKQGSVQVTGKIEPVPGGSGGGGPSERPFDISVLQKWAHIYYSVPANGTNIFVAPGSTNDLTSLVRLGTGQAASGTVNWSSGLGTFTANNVALAAGSASTSFIATGSPGSVGTINATGQNLKDTGNISVPNVTSNISVGIAKVEFSSLGGTGTSVQYDSSVGKLYLAAGIDFVAQVKTSNWDSDWKAEFVQGIRIRFIDHYTNGTTTTNYITGSSTSYCLDNHDPYSNESFSYTGSGTQIVETSDNPSKVFDIPLAISLGIDSSSVLFEFEMYVGYHLPVSGARKGLGIVQWSWGGTVNINTNGTSSLSSPIAPGNPSGTGESTIPTYNCTFSNT